MLQKITILVFCLIFSVNGLNKIPFNALNQLNKEPPIPKQVSTKAVQTNWIEQRLDHFDLTNMETWNMRYLSNDEHLQPGGPIFIYIGGEWTVSPGWIQGGHAYDMTKEFNGIIFYTEHRYYGQSQPTQNITTDNLRYLTIDQALADLAMFITHIKATIPEVEDSGVILVGASYSATMATWFRQKYPHLIEGAWASSGPLNAQVDFIEYKEVVGESIEYIGGLNCYNRLEGAFAQMEELVANDQGDILMEQLNICEPFDFDNELDVMNLFGGLSNQLSGIVQYHWFGDIEGMCEELYDNSVDDFTAFANWINSLYGMYDCLDFSYNGFIEYYSDVSWGSYAALSAGRQWIYQTCSEFGWYQTSGSEDQPFGSSFPVELYHETCSDLYDNIFNATDMENNVIRVNRMYGGFNPEVTNVYFTQGQLDPWRPMGIQEDLNEFSPATVIPLHSHCADLYSISVYDTPEMLASKLRIRDLIMEWLGL